MPGLYETHLGEKRFHSVITAITVALLSSFSVAGETPRHPVSRLTL